METNIKQVVLWNYKLHSHTHSYIHYAFKKAFEHMGYKTLWLDSKDNIKNIDFTNSLFIAASQDENIPLRVDSYYVLHNCNMKKYDMIPYKHKLIIQVYTNDIINKVNEIPNNKLCFYLENCLFMPWATDLLPHEIDENIKLVKDNKIKSKNIINFIGMTHNKWDNLKRICMLNNIIYKEMGGYTGNNIESEKNMELIQESIIAPAIQTDWQTDKGYIPCRIFKNISYGKMGLTNNKTVYNLFDKKIIYDNSVFNLFKKGLLFEKMDCENKNKIIIPLMENVRDNHTYLNRIKLIFWMFNKIL